VATHVRSTPTHRAPRTKDRDSLASLRSREFSRLDLRGETYLDYTGSALYAESHVLRHAALLRDSVLGNPHSDSPASRASTAYIDDARTRLLRFFDADPRQYAVCFTANATGALRLVGEGYPFAPGSRLLLSADNHNSVNGIRELARTAGADVSYVPLDAELRLRSAAEVLRDTAPTRGSGRRSLFAFPAQSNFSGVQHPLDLVRVAHRHGHDVLLDAASYAPASPLSLREVPADFVCVSFYKMFGYPTGIGALIARRAALARLRRPWFGGGTVEWVSVQNESHRLKDGPEGFEDGTPSFAALPALAAGFDLLEEVGMPRLRRHVRRLTELLIADLRALRHSNGRSMVLVYGPAGMESRGGTVAFNVVDVDGRIVPYALVETRARESRASVRGGCFCNPGAAEHAFGFPAEETAACLAEQDRGAFSLERFAECMGARPVGAVRMSLGLASNDADVRRGVEVVAAWRDQNFTAKARYGIPGNLGSTSEPNAFQNAKSTASFSPKKRSP
jgi:selenocysteine lyase/cysteine desulfurase